MSELVNKRCTLCGDLMENVAPRRRYCDSCKGSLHEARITGRRKKNIEKKVKKKEQTGILAVVRKANALGMSYGQYVAKFDARRGNT